MKVDGRCHCGQVTYTAVVDPAQVRACHCLDCQIMTGAAYRVSVTADKDSLKLSGEVRTYTKTADSGNRRVHAFCPRCGTPIYATSEEPSKHVSLRVGGLSQRNQLPPTQQLWMKSAVPWSQDLRDIPRVERQK